MLAALSLAACSQSRGDPCQVTSDCGSGLLCCPAEETPRGVCIQADTCPDTTPVEAGTGQSDNNGNDDDAG
jgi:hypothetical protein